MALIHGGDTESFYFEYGYPPLDFSACCNPLGVPAGVKQAIREAICDSDVYPDPLCRRLCAAIAAHERVLSEQVLCGNGSSDLIFRLALALKPRRAMVTAPTFAEYETALETVGCEVFQYLLHKQDGFTVTDNILEKLTPETDMLFLCNPNNPTGLVMDSLLLQRILAVCEKNGTLLVMDECFNGFLDKPEACSLKKEINTYRNLIILKAFTKLYGMAGIRLGYCITDNKEIIEKIRKAGQPWAVSSLAQAAGIRAMSEDEYVRKARMLIRTEKSYLTAALKELGIMVLGHDANYIFFYSEIPRLTEGLCHQGILIRDCGNYKGLRPGYYRIAVLNHNENTRLIEEITALK